MLIKKDYVVFGVNIIHKNMARKISAISTTRSVSASTGAGYAQHGRKDEFYIKVFGSDPITPMYVTSFPTSEARDAAALELVTALFAQDEIAPDESERTPVTNIDNDVYADHFLSKSERLWASQ